MSDELKGRLGTALLIIIVITALAFIPVKWSEQRTTSQKETSASLLIKNNVETLPPNGDADGDGIPNWEEKLRGTDPYSKDTLSVSQTQNAKTLANDPSTKNLNDPNNLTVSLAKDNLTVASYYASSSDPVADKQALNTLSSNILDQTQKKFSFTNHTESELTVVSSLSNDSLKSLGNMIATSTTKILLKYLTSKTDSDDITNLQTVETGGQTASEAKIRLIQKAQDVALFRDTLIHMKVPKDLVTTHLAFINAIEAYRETLLAFSTTEDDPLKTFIVFPQYQTITSAMFSTFKGYGIYFTKKNIIFTRNESGYVFTAGFSTN